MAVAVKNAPETRPTPSPFDRMQVAALAGMVYVLGSLAIVFKLIPMLWVWVWSTRLGFRPDSFAALTIQGLLMLAGGSGLFLLGGKLLGPKPQSGLKAAIFVGLVGLLVAALLTRWYSIWAEYLAFHPEVVPVWGGSVGIQGAVDFFFFLFSTLLFLPSILGGWYGAMAMTIAVGVILVALLLKVFFGRRAERFLIGFEEQGWFSGTNYKKNQGARVRRGTILGILLLIGSGVWTMVSHNTLAGSPDNWNLNIPFTGVETFTVDRLALPEIGLPLREELRKEHPDWFEADKPAEELSKALADLKTRLSQARKQEQKEKSAPLIASALAWAGVRPALWQAGWLAETLVHAQKRTIPELTNTLELIQERLAQGYDDDEARKVLNLLNAEVKPPLDALIWQEAGTTKLNLPPVKIDAELPEWFDAVARATNKDWLKDLAEVAGKAADKALAAQAAASKPITLNRYAMQTLNKQIDPSTHVMLYDLVPTPGITNYEVVTKAKYEEIKKKAEQEGERVPEARAPTPIAGPETLASITLLPSVRYSLPLLLLALTFWFAWRVVNLPVFADFLIATEGELNKVSWTTRRRLFQDTIVVLVTLILLAFYLFAMDQVWLHVLSWKPIGVIVLPPEDKNAAKGAEKPW